MTEKELDGIVIGICDDPKVGVAVQLRIKVDMGEVPVNMSSAYARQIAARILVVADSVSPLKVKTP